MIMSLGNSLYNARKKSGLSQEEVAEKLRYAGIKRHFSACVEYKGIVDLTGMRNY